MSQDSSLVGAFDLNSQTGVMSILASIRGSKLSAPEKNELRDLVFLYTNGGGDASVRIALEQKLATHKIAPIQVMSAVQSGPVLPFGSYRPTPTFRKTPQVATAPAPAQVPVPTPVAPVEAVAPVDNTPLVTPVTVTPTTPAPAPTIVQPIPVVASVVPNSAPIPTPVLPPEIVVNTPIPAPAPISGEVNYIERIRQIKTAVNSKVGNPVNLVDINNEVGREYMNALLEAMKKLSSGAVSEMEPAMKRLETAYVTVEAAIAEHNKTTTATAVVSAPIETAASVSESIEAVVAPVIPIPEPQAPIIERQIPPPPTIVADDLPPRPLPPVIEQQIPVPLPPQIEEIPRSEVPEPIYVAPMQVVEEEMVEEIPEPIQPSNSFALADRQKILTPQDLPEASAVSTGATGDPLFTQEVDNGLNQLLTDWTLFKKSGLFGTGPKGREHPLFKKIADLQVPLLLAGRFDGATQEIRQSITDYMNGWRYEQGIIYQPGETFEKYLRRVIKHIIDLQKKHKHP